MAKEIERKFLVTGTDWMTPEPTYYCQGYLNRDKFRTVRVRIAGDRLAESFAEGQPDVHPGRVVLHGRVDELPDLGELDDLVELGEDLRPLHAQDGAV